MKPFKILDMGRHPVVRNPWALIQFEGSETNYVVIRQAGLGIWAFALRTQLSTKEAKDFDQTIESSWNDRERLRSKRNSSRLVTS